MEAFLENFTLFLREKWTSDVEAVIRFVAVTSCFRIQRHAGFDSGRQFLDAFMENFSSVPGENGSRRWRSSSGVFLRVASLIRPGSLGRVARGDFDFRLSWCKGRSL